MAAQFGGKCNCNYVGSLFCVVSPIRIILFSVRLLWWQKLEAVLWMKPQEEWWPSFSTTPYQESSILLAGMESESFGGSNCLRLYNVWLLTVRLLTFMCKQRLFGRVEIVLRKSVESNQFYCMQIIVHTWTNNTPNYENMDQVYCLF